MAQFYLECLQCKYQTPEDKYYVHCPKCGGFLEVKLDNDLTDRTIDQSKSSIFKYHRFMPFEPTKDMIDKEDIEDIPEFVDSQISDILDVEIIIKDETCFPTGTWKDREGFVSLYRLHRNNISDLMVFSSGNTGTSLARSACMFKGPRLHMIIPEASAKRVEKSMSFIDPKYVKLYFSPGSNDECIIEANRIAQEKGILPEGGFSNYARREGLKLLGLEHICKNEHNIDWYAQPIAGGIGVYSFEKAYDDCGKECPRILGVQAEICAPMVNAWRDDVPLLEKRHIPDIISSDFVRVLRTRNPSDGYPILKNIMDRRNGAFEDVSDDEILAGLRTFYRSDYFKERYHRDGVIMGLEPATALAGVIKATHNGLISKGSKVLLNVSGAAKDGDVKLEWLNDLL